MKRLIFLTTLMMNSSLFAGFGDAFWSQIFKENQKETITISGKCTDRTNTIIDNEWYNFDTDKTKSSEITIGLYAYKRKYNTNKYLFLGIKILSFDGDSYEGVGTGIFNYRDNWKINGWDYKNDYPNLASFTGFFSEKSNELVISTVNASSNKTYGVYAKETLWSTHCKFILNLNELYY